MKISLEITGHIVNEKEDGVELSRSEFDELLGDLEDTLEGNTYSGHRFVQVEMS